MITIYLSIEQTTHNIFFESLYGNIKVLENECKIGDILTVNGIKYLVTSTLNPEIVYEGQKTDNIRMFPKGSYVQLAEVDYIYKMISDSELKISGFDCYKEVNRFYKLKGFDKDMNEITDKDLYRDVTRYIYINNNIKG